jgi:hypothetical protein
METELKLIALNQIVEDAELYPRNHENWFLVNKYAKAMSCGAVFPPITVAFYAGQYYLVDGKHRKEAYKENEVSDVQVEVLKLNTREEIYAEAVKRNVSHGASLSTQETVNAILKLRGMKFADVEISKLISIPLGKLESFVCDRMVNSITGEEIGVKAPLAHLAGQTVNPDVIDGQSVYAVHSQEHIVNQMIQLLETETFNKKNKPLMEKLKVVHNLIEKLVLKGRRR